MEAFFISSPSTATLLGILLVLHDTPPILLSLDEESPTGPAALPPSLINFDPERSYVRQLKANMDSGEGIILKNNDDRHILPHEPVQHITRMQISQLKQRQKKRFYRNHRF